MTPSWAAFALGAVLLAAPVSAPAATAAPDVSAKVAAAATKHDVDLLWKPDVQDNIPGPIVEDSFDSYGPPFGKEAPLVTRIPRKQVGSDQRSGKWRVFLTQGKDPGSCSGTFSLELNVIETTTTHQTVQYGGTVRLTKCKGVKKFRNVQPGKLGDLQGETICTANSCRGGFEIDGILRF
jgi:hypothetical protein